MKKTLLIPFLILALSGCSLPGQDKCAQYRDPIDQELKNNCGTDPSCSFRVDQVFYSPKTKSCLYGFYRQRLLSTGTEAKAQSVDQWAWYLISDFVNKKILYTSKQIKVYDLKAMEEKKAEYEEKLKEFQQ